MSLSNFCIQQRQKEQQVLRTWLVCGSIGSLCLHVAIALSVSRWWQPETKTANAPIEVIFVETPKPEVQPSEKEIQQPEPEVKVAPSEVTQIIEQPQPEIIVKMPKLEAVETPVSPIPEPTPPEIVESEVTPSPPKPVTESSVQPLPQEPEIQQPEPVVTQSEPEIQQPDPVVTQLEPVATQPESTEPIQPLTSVEEVNQPSADNSPEEVFKNNYDSAISTPEVDTQNNFSNTPQEIAIQPQTASPVKQPNTISPESNNSLENVFQENANSNVNPEEATQNISPTQPEEIAIQPQIVAPVSQPNAITPGANDALEGFFSENYDANASTPENSSSSPSPSSPGEVAIQPQTAAPVSQPNAITPGANDALEGVFGENYDANVSTPENSSSSPSPSSPGEVAITPLTSPGLPQGNGDLNCISRCNPAYPKALRDRGLEGRTIVNFSLDGNGSVKSANIAVSSGYAELDRAAVESVKKMKFTPVENGEARTIAINFTMAGSTFDRQVRGN